MNVTSLITNNAKSPGKNFLVFLLYWIILFIIYLPAADAGRVGDFPGWVEAVTTRSFADYVNRTGTQIASLYQLTQVITWFFYKLFGTNAWMWHLLYLTLQALNTLLLVNFFTRLFSASSIKNSYLISFAGGLLFCLCPHISEVVVWEPSFHYLTGLLYILVILHCTQLFITTEKAKYAWLGGIIFFLSTFSLEVYYLTPLFVATLIFYYRKALQSSKSITWKALKLMLLPQLVLFGLHLLLLNVVYHKGIAHTGSVPFKIDAAIFSAPLKYLFHILFFGRYFSDAFRTTVYNFCESAAGSAMFYVFVAFLMIYIMAFRRRLTNQGKAALLVFVWTALSMGLVLPLWFPKSGNVIYDRYTYVTDAFIYIFLALLLSNFLKNKIFISLVLIYGLINYRFTHRANAYWQQSADIVNNLLATFPNDPSKKVLLLSLPECLDGVQMVGTRDDGEFRMMYNAMMPHKISNPVYDVEAFYMRSPADGVHVMVLNDSTVRVTLNQWGTWWLYYGFGATSYENNDYKVDMRDVGHWYNVILKHPPSDYLLLYSIGRDWKRVDMNKQNVDQY